MVLGEHWGGGGGMRGVAVAVLEMVYISAKCRVAGLAGYVLRK